MGRAAGAKELLICLFPGQLPPGGAVAAAKQPGPPGICRYALGKLLPASCRQPDPPGAGVLDRGELGRGAVGALLRARVLPQPRASLPGTAMVLDQLDQPWPGQRGGLEVAPRLWGAAPQGVAGLGRHWCPRGHQALALPLVQGRGAELTLSYPGPGLCPQPLLCCPRGRPDCPIPPAAHHPTPWGTSNPGLVGHPLTPGASPNPMGHR